MRGCTVTAIVNHVNTDRGSPSVQCKEASTYKLAGSQLKKAFLPTIGYLTCLPAALYLLRVVTHPGSGVAVEDQSPQAR